MSLRKLFISLFIIGVLCYVVAFGLTPRIPGFIGEILGVMLIAIGAVALLLAMIVTFES